MPSDKHDITVLIKSQGARGVSDRKQFKKVKGDSVDSHEREGEGSGGIRKSHQTLPFIISE